MTSHVKQCHPRNCNVRAIVDYLLSLVTCPAQRGSLVRLSKEVIICRVMNWSEVGELEEACPLSLSFRETVQQPRRFIGHVITFYWSRDPKRCHVISTRGKFSLAGKPLVIVRDLLIAKSIVKGNSITVLSANVSRSFEGGFC